MRRLDQALQIRECAEMRSHAHEIAPCIAVVVAVSILYHRGNPDRGRTECLDVIELLFNALEIAPMHSLAGGSIVVSVGIIIGHVAIEKPISDDLINVLPLPQILAMSGHT